MKAARPSIVSFGEVLWDILPDAEYLCGAPANFSQYCHALGADVRLVSRVGNDARGERMERILEEKGLLSTHVRIDGRYPTGAVTVSVHDGQPFHLIHQPVAWDYIEATAEGRAAARAADAIYFGTLAQRSICSRQSLAMLIEATNPQAVRFLDINLRAPFFSHEILAASLRLANALKLNEEELKILSLMFGLPDNSRNAIVDLADIFNLQLIALTPGERGSVILWHGEMHEHCGLTTNIGNPTSTREAFSAGLVMAILAGWEIQEASCFANEIAAFVASRPGATPALPPALVAQFHRSCGPDLSELVCG